MYQIISTLITVINFYCIIIFIWAILSWFQNTNKSVRDIYKVLDTIVKPYVDIFRKMIPPMGGMDLSPLAALLALQLVSRLLVWFF